MNDDYEIPEEDLNNPRYHVGGVFLLSKWIREHVHQEHKFKVGDTVVITITTEVKALQRDCDGTPLYKLEGIGGGWSEVNMRLASDEESK